jgi:hypothetical protein
VLAYLLPENLYRVFNETDLDKRKAAIALVFDTLANPTPAMSRMRVRFSDQKTIPEARLFRKNSKAVLTDSNFKNC